MSAASWLGRVTGIRRPAPTPEPTVEPPRPVARPEPDAADLFPVPEPRPIPAPCGRLGGCFPAADGRCLYGCEDAA